ncbi:MAG: cytochrome-c peroxidase, partial [Nevskia sp.]|nr:cytochrome-c peroxidase [Nevskia sp.]
AFRAHCASCHVEPLFSDFSYRDNGLDAAPRDVGRATVTARAVDRGSYRVPSLRTIGLTPPNMHDARYDTLAQVLDHYRSRVAGSDHVDPLLRGGLPISAEERAALLAFLPTLDDPGFTHDLRFADPARRR